MYVMKFGGSSVENAEVITRVADILATHKKKRPIAVVSALKGVTDSLLGLARDANAGCEAALLRNGCKDLVTRHHDTVVDLLGRGDDADALTATLANDFAELEAALLGIASLKELSGRSFDLVASFGERLSAPIVSAALRSRGVPSEPVDARRLIVTDDRFMNATVDFGRTRARVMRILHPMVEQGVVPIVTGFVAATPDGITTTLGRGGSDYTASVLGNTLGAKEVWIWKEVDGVMTADPNAVPEAMLLSRITYDEAAEMSYFGAKVLHPKTMIPAVESAIPIRIRNTFNPTAVGTRIGTEGDLVPQGVKVVTAIKDLSMVTVEGKGMIGTAGLAGHVFDVAARARINILMFSQSSSEQSICLIVTADDGVRFGRTLEEGLQEEVRSRVIDRISTEDGVAAIAVVGEGMKGTPGIAANLFAAVAGVDVNVLAIAQGSSERNISFIVKKGSADTAVRAIHAAFALHTLPAHICA